MADEVELLSSEEIALMVAYLEEFPPRVPPPVDLPWFDVRRIAATLTHLDTSLTNAATRNNHLAGKLKYCELSRRGAIDQRNNCLRILCGAATELSALLDQPPPEPSASQITRLRDRLRDFEFWKEHECP